MFNNARTEARRGALAGGGDQADSNGTTKRGVQAGSFPSFVFTAASRRGAFRSDTGGAVESRLDLLAEDVMRKAETVRHREREGRALTMAEQEDFLRRLEGHRLRNLFLFYIYTGVRRCEALALRWADVDFARKQITVRGTKTASSFRTLAMLPEVEQLLKEQRRQAAGERVFPWCASHVSKQFKKLCGGHKLHDLRHTFVTRCAESGINVNVAQQLAGHSDIKTTLKTYTHVSADFIRREYIKYTLSPYAERRGN